MMGQSNTLCFSISRAKGRDNKVCHGRPEMALTDTQQRLKAPFVRVHGYWNPLWEPILTLDRIDNDGNYAPGSCRWARNRRDTVIVGTPWGRICLKDAARFSGISYATIQRRRRAGRDLLAPPRW
jgi:hypothetical protein